MANALGLDELRAAVSAPQIADPFALLREVSAFCARDNFGASAQELALRILDQQERFNGYGPFIDALTRRFGLFPYISEPGDLPLRDALAVELHRAQNLSDRQGGTIVFHREQAAVFHALMRGENVILSAPTSFGKSLIIDAVLAEGKHRNVVVVLPTLALIDETRRRFLRFKDTFRIITHGSQAVGERNIFVVTQERLLEKLPSDEIDFFVIDEFYKLSPDLDNEEEDGRAMLLNQALYLLVRSGAQFYMLGPNVRSIPMGTQQKLEARFVATSYATVVSEAVEVPPADNDEDRLLSLLPQLTEPTIVYCRSPRRATEVARTIAEALPDVPLAVGDLCDWLGREYHPDWSFVSSLRRGVGTHHGQLPRAVGQILVRRFNDGDLRFLVCTSTLIEGVNTCAKNVVLFDNAVGRRGLDYFTFNNIRGRSGRMFQHFIGRVFLFHPAPQMELPLVDLPVFTQPEGTAPSLLIQLDDGDLTERSQERLTPYREQTALSQDVLRANIGVDLDEQIRVAEEIAGSVDELWTTLGWRGDPPFDALVATLGFLRRFPLAGRGAPGLNDRAAASLIMKFKRRVPLRQVIAEQLPYSGGDADKAVSDTLRFIRNYLGFGLPKGLRALDRIQSEVFRRAGRVPGDYESFCRKVENIFLPGMVFSLEEFGVPLPLAARIEASLGDAETLDDAIEALRAVDVTELDLDPIEVELLLKAQEGL